MVTEQGYRIFKSVENILYIGVILLLTGFARFPDLARLLDGGIIVQPVDQFALSGEHLHAILGGQPPDCSMLVGGLLYFFAC